MQATISKNKIPAHQLQIMRARLTEARRSGFELFPTTSVIIQQKIEVTRPSKSTKRSPLKNAGSVVRNWIAPTPPPIADTRDRNSKMTNDEL